MPGLLPAAKARWPERRRAALADPTMRAAVVRTTKNLAQGKATAFATYPHGEEMRVEAASARRRALGRIDELLAELATRVETNGGSVVHAAGPADVGRYVIGVARRRGARRIVKSKSMATEEVALNEQLQAAGLEVRETDLGEYIIQLAGERPSHIVAPAAHNTRGQIRELFEHEAALRYVTSPIDDGTPSLTAFSRRQLREDFLAADIGVTGGNFLVAETGTLVLVTNEGNGRATTSLPPVHIAVVGIDKVVATWDYLCAVLQQPSLNGTGQLVSTYVSLITGPRRSGELDGPEEFHLVLLDNGRRDLIGT